MKVLVMAMVVAVLGAGCATNDKMAANELCDPGDSECEQNAATEADREAKRAEHDRKSAVNNNRNRVPDVSTRVRPPSPP